MSPTVKKSSEPGLGDGDGHPVGPAVQNPPRRLGGHDGHPGGVPAGGGKRPWGARAAGKIRKRKGLWQS